MTGEPKVNKLKIYGVAFLILLFGNFAYETLITVIESQFPVSLYETFPYTRFAFLVATVMLTNRYVRKRSGQSPIRRNAFLRTSKWFLLIALFIGLTIGVLANIKGVAPTALNNMRDSQEYLEANKEQYVKCYNSLSTGMLIISTTSLNYAPFGAPEDKREIIKKAEEDFKKKINTECDEPVKKYESTNEEYKSASAVVAVASVSVLDKMTGRMPMNASEFQDYDASRLVFAYGGFQNMTFTEEDVIQYFEQQL